MKKKTRSITLSGADFRYRVAAIGTWPGVLSIRIWSVREQAAVLCSPSVKRLWRLEIGWVGA